MVGVTGFEPAASTSQTSRATNCATPRCGENIQFFAVFPVVKSVIKPLIMRILRESRVPKKSVVYTFSQAKIGFSAFFASSGSVSGVLLPKHARYQLRHTSICIYFRTYILYHEIFPLSTSFCKIVRKFLLLFFGAAGIFAPSRNSFLLSSLFHKFPLTFSLIYVIL